MVEFDLLTPLEVMKYCYRRGFLKCLWECGGSLAAPAVVRMLRGGVALGVQPSHLLVQADGVFHKVHAFVAPKLIGGSEAPSPLGGAGFEKMTQALPVCDISYEVIWCWIFCRPL